jgi:hypothetical protein
MELCAPCKGDWPIRSCMPYVATMKGYLKSPLLNRAVDTTPAAAIRDRAGLDSLPDVLLSQQTCSHRIQGFIVVLIKLVWLAVGFL